MERGGRGEEEEGVDVRSEEDEVFAAEELLVTVKEGEGVREGCAVVGGRGEGLGTVIGAVETLFLSVLFEGLVSAW